MFVSLTNIGMQIMRSYSLRTAYLIFEAHFQFFFQQFPSVLQLWRFFIKWYQKEWSIKLRIDNGGWHETWNLLMLHFVTFTWNKAKVVNKLSRVRRTDWKSSQRLTDWDVWRRKRWNSAICYIYGHNQLIFCNTLPPKCNLQFQNFSQKIHYTL